MVQCRSFCVTEVKLFSKSFIHLNVFSINDSQLGLHYVLRKFVRKISNIDFCLKFLPLKDDELVMSEM